MGISNTSRTLTYIRPKIICSQIYCEFCTKEFNPYRKNQKFCSRFCAGDISGHEAMANLKRGIQAERRCCQELSNKGYHVSRSAASKGEYDVIAISDSEILLIQVKRTRAKNRVFLKKDILKLKAAQSPNNSIVKKQLWTWLDRVGWKILDI